LRKLRTEQEIMRNWKGDSSKPVVSICCITYNHEKYIEDALEGFLIQKTDFPFEILINDDASTDSTADIIREYEAQYPNLIKPIYQTENQYSQGKKPNQEFNFPRAIGKYIALCEGDDYWQNSLKLEKQVDFLEKNKDYGLVHTDAHWLFYKTGKIIQNWHRYNGKLISQGNIYEKLIEENQIFTCTACARKCFIDKFILKDDFCDPNFLMGDYPTWLYISRKSKVGYLDFASATRRLLEESASKSKDLEKRWKFVSSSHDIKKKFMEKYPVSAELERQISIQFNKTKLYYAIRMMQLGMAMDAYKYLSRNKSISYIDGLKALLNRVLSKARY
jgi:glycosyltransferase involved in cell wall biosynthesis